MKLSFMVAESNKTNEYTNNVKTIVNQVGMKLLHKKFPHVFTRKGRLVGHNFFIELNGEQKSLNRRISLQWQKAVDSEIKIVFEASHAKRVAKSQTRCSYNEF